MGLTLKNSPNFFFLDRINKTMKHLLRYDDFLAEGFGIESDTPLQRLSRAYYTPDRQQVFFEGVFYYAETGERVPINELFGWSLSDILHAGADVLSAVIDNIIPGSGAVVDILNGVSYIIEAQFVDEEKRGSLYLMSAITFAFVVIPSALQAVSIPLKNFVKSGAKAATGIVKTALETLAKFMPTVLKEIPARIASALKSSMARVILGKWGGKIGAALTKWGDDVMKAFNKLLGKSVDTVTNVAGKVVNKVVPKAVLDSAMVTSLKKFFAKEGVERLAPKASEKLLRKCGFLPGKSYRYIAKNGKSTTAKIVGSTVDGKSVLLQFKRGNSIAVPVETFMARTIGAPWGRRGYTVAAPLFVKHFARTLTSDGEVDPIKIEGLEELSAQATSDESFQYYMDELPDYDGAGEGEKVAFADIANYSPPAAG